MKRQIYQIEIKNENRFLSETGFFCNIQYEHNLSLKLLITTNHILNENDISIGKKINFLINNKNYEILIDESKKYLLMNN